jgi:hypothetical protein
VDSFRKKMGLAPRLSGDREREPVDVAVAHEEASQAVKAFASEVAKAKDAAGLDGGLVVDKGTLFAREVVASLTALLPLLPAPGSGGTTGTPPPAVGLFSHQDCLTIADRVKVDPPLPARPSPLPAPAAGGGAGVRMGYAAAELKSIIAGPKPPNDGQLAVLTAVAGALDSGTQICIWLDGPGGTGK